jgi:serine/threonine protein kinase
MRLLLQSHNGSSLVRAKPNPNIPTKLLIPTMTSAIDTESSLVMTSNSTNDDAEDVQSEASTIRYSWDPTIHEAFETFRYKIAAVAGIQFKQHISNIKVEHMKGGSYNRVAALIITPQPRLFSLAWFRALLGIRFRTWLFSWFSSWFLGLHAVPATLESRSYIVRVPRGNGDDKNSGVARDTAIHKAVSALLDLPIPKVVCYDPTTNNAMEKAYMIQTRLPGQNLSTLLNKKTLNIEQMKHIARRVTELVPTITAIEGPAGNISLDTLTSDSKHLQVESLHLQYDELGDKSHTLPEEPQDAFDHLWETCRRWSEYHRSRRYSPYDEIWHNFGRIVLSLYNRDFLDGPCVLVHRDLMPYNLLVDVSSDTEVEITGVIDWDSAVIAPEFMAYRAPFWLWSLDGVATGIDSNEETVNISPLSEEATVLKQVFLDNASEKLKLFAFSPEAILTRRMYVILKEGIFTDWYVEEAWQIVREWHALHPDDEIVLPELCPGSILYLREQDKKEFGS